MSNDHIKVYYYLRVSGAGQVDKDGPERQLESCKAFAGQHRLLSSATRFFERGVSGTVEGIDRPEFSRMLEYISDDRHEGPKAILVERMDRLARDLMVQEFLLRECRARGIQVFAADQGACVDMASDGGDPTRKLIRQVLGALAEWEKSALVLKLRKARDRKREAEGRCEGPLPYGSTPAEQKVLRAMLDLTQVCDTYLEIADKLNDAGLLTRHGKPWGKNTVHRTLLKYAKRTGGKEVQMKDAV